MTLVYKIMTPEEQAQMARSGLFPGSPIDRTDGYVHLSTAAQVIETVRRHFADMGGLVLAAADAEALGAGLRFEPSRGGDLFPHLYRDLKSSDILWSRDFDSRRPDDLQNFLAG